MRSCIALFYILLFAPLGTAQPDPDALYRNRSNKEDARAAASIWDARLRAAPRDFDAAWKLARVLYWLGRHETTDDARRRALERGIEAGRAAVAVHGERPDGHFWIAANMGALAESFGLRQGLKYRADIRRELEIVLTLDPAYQKGSADRALGRWYHKVPGLFGGSNRKSEEHLRRSLTYHAQSTVSHFFLAETLFDMDRDDEAIEELKKVIAAPPDPDWAPEDREYKQRAAELLKQKTR